MKKKAIITGATSGIGLACAMKFAKNNWDLILTGRRSERLEKIKEELLGDYDIEIHIRSFDVRDKMEVKKNLTYLPEGWTSIDLLINNAGLASGLELIQDGDSEDWDKMIDTNIKGLLYVSEIVIPHILKADQGHIINIGSTAGKEVYRNGGVYCATKHAVDAISKSMRIDLLSQGVKVTQICPGAAETEFSLVRFHGDSEKAKNAYNGYTPMSGSDVAQIVFYTTTLPAHLCINDLVLTSIQQANSHYVERNE